MKQARFERLLAPISLAAVFLAALIGVLSRFAFAADVSASAQAAATVPSSAEMVNATVQAAGAYTISNIIGATYDEARGEVIVFGIADPNLPPLNFSYIRENLVVALRAFYASSGSDLPGVSIEGTQNPLSVIYFGGVTNTHFGQVSFESDRLLKIYTLGKDNLTGITVTSAVTGYMSYPDRMSRLSETAGAPTLIRYFFTPTLQVEPITTPHSIVFSRTTQLVDWAYASVATSTASTQAAQGFVDNFNQYYFEYAAERRSAYGDTTLYEMVQLSKLAAIAQWIQAEGLELKLPGINDPWLSHYPVAFSATVTQTPGITVTWVQTISGAPYEVSLRGGVYAPGTVVRIPVSPEDQALAVRVHQYKQPPQPPPMVYLVSPDKVHPLSTGGAATLAGSNLSAGPCVAYVIPLAADAVVNGDFEGGPDSAWVQNSWFEMIMTDSPHSGIYGTIFPIYSNARVSLSQTLYIPSDATMARLTYWRAAATAETTHPHDFFASFLSNASGARLATFETLDDGDADGYWHQVSFDVITYTGQTVQLWFTATTNATNITNFFVDDISLDYLDPTPPSVVSVTGRDRVALSDVVQFSVVFHERMKASVPPTVTINHGPVSYTLTAKAGTGYANGYSASDPTRWYGVYTFTSPMPEGDYTVDVLAAQDLAGNVMYPARDVYTLTFDATPPQVQSVHPASGAGGVAVNAGIVITFSEAISTSAFSYTVSPDPGGLAQSWDSAKRVVTLTHNAFASETTYTVTVTQARDLAGNPLANAPVVWSFTTSDTTPPQVQNKSPSAGASGVSIYAGIVVTFSEPISAGTFAYSVSPNPAGWGESWDSARRVVTLDHAAFVFGATYTVTITQAQDLTGNSLNGAPVTWLFTTEASDLTPPQVQHVYPADGTGGAGINASVVITFSEPISVSTFSYSVSPNPGGWTESWNSTQRVVALTHNAFALGTTYTVTVTRARDLAGNSLSGAPYAWHFATVIRSLYLPVVLRDYP
jgi:hypothetical protein